MQKIKAADNTVSFWVSQDDDKDKTDFVYRAKSAVGSPPKCYGVAASDPRSNWTVLDKSALALPRCLARDGPTTPGTLYDLRRRA